MSTQDKIRNIFLYLLSIKNMDKKIIRDVSKYEKVIAETDLLNKKGCILNKKEDENWLYVNKDCSELYNILFKIYSTLEKNSEDLEIVWGHSILGWEVNNEKILHPIFTTKMSLNFDARNAVFSLTPYNNITNLEIGILEGLDLPNLHKILDLNLEIKNSGVDVLNLSEAHDISIRLLNCLNKEGITNIVNENLVSLSSLDISTTPVIYNAPCIILRNIDTRLWDSELNNILNYIDEGNPIPKTVEALVKESGAAEDNLNNREWDSASKDVLFPLPANEEQEEITRRLAQNFGVVVQGPPGTGKSHTIANLICHLMAHGKRILVTSQTDRALKVLSDKIPDEIKSLCISLLGNDAKALKDLDESVRKITENLSLDSNVLLKEVLPLEEELKKCREHIVNLMHNLKEAESFENKTVNYKNETFTLVELSRWIKENSSLYSWIDDEIQIKTKCPLSSEEFNRLIQHMKSTKKAEIDKLNKVKDILCKLPPYEELNVKLDKMKTLESGIEEYRRIVDLWKISINNADIEELLKLCINAKAKIEEIESSWLKSIMKSYYNTEVSREFWPDVILNINNHIKQINVIRQIINSHNIKIPNNLDIYKLQTDFQIISKHIESKGKPGAMFKLLHNNINYILESCEVDYRPIISKEQCNIFNKALEKELLERSLKNLWNNTVKEYGGKLVNNSDSNFLNVIAENVLEIEAIINWEEEYVNPINKFVESIKLPIELNLYKKDSINYLLRGLESVKCIREYEDLSKYTENIRKMFLNNELLSEVSDWIADCDKTKVRKLYDNLWQLRELKDTGEQINRYLNRLEGTCPLFVKKLLNEWQSNNLSLSYNNWDEAWKWRSGNSLLNEVYKLSPEQIEQDIEAEKLREKILIKEIVAKKTWYNQIMRTTESQKRSLFTWLESIKRIGKGTGKQAAKYRKLAQREMENCKEVIPVWIMPLNKVIENIKLEKNIFDVVIVDESSQSDISAITALLRGKRAVIVGDECQISPEAIGKDNEMVENLIHRYLRNVPHKEWFDLKTSLYHTALRVFPSRLVLKEHFRCAPDIIGFSNNLCYSGEIIPLRCPENRNTFKPEVCAVKVSGDKDNSKNTNEKEAEALVEKIVECCDDPRYKDMTMGVISLLGESQSELIENLLKEKIGIEKMIERKLICGDAYSFQGDERDIMFVSLVIANNAKFTALTKESDIRRFNVAASRAKNQMFLFHSVDLEDLNSKCVRAELLSYCLDSSKKYTFISKDENTLVSGFKKDIFTMLRSKNYDVKSNVTIGKYKIDFVVEGLNSRFAIDCCSEDTAYALNWEELHNRRMTLQRVGWKFFIIRESQFYYKPEETMERLYAQLDSLGIKPAADSGAQASLEEAAYAVE
ncbi:AAA domain-containing protein [Clostridium sp. OS1-26]|uniref:AAA domain-containing protein n=1 Tax=Clostridium sp. OS1-26 TaxID=3070681 RepID=UPI0027DF7D21|nr:AAA domain-containing protein [Clostridium sp. OS1-26]WML33787.1 AAA domain-containing protein [Clostridium sp. OS1-26]